MSWLRWLERAKKGAMISSSNRAYSTNPKPTPGDSGTVVRREGSANPKAPKFRMSFKPGDVVADNLKIRKLLGRGGMGEVWLARQTQWDVDVAVKVATEEILADPQNRHRIEREADAWSELGLHSHIAYCHYAKPFDERLLLVVEYVDGGTLTDWIGDGRCADLKAGMNLAIQFCHGLERAHSRGLVHRDIKPDNILLTKDGILKITDFGIVRRTLAGADSTESAVSGSRTPTHATTTIAGTYAYMAPEQWAAPQAVDHRADIFGMGVCFYEMLCGRRPYSGGRPTLGPREDAPEPSQLRGDGQLPQRLSELMKRCVAWEPEERPERARGAGGTVRSVRATLRGMQPTCRIAGDLGLGGRLEQPGALVLRTGTDGGCGEGLGAGSGDRSASYGIGLQLRIASLAECEDLRY